MFGVRAKYLYPQQSFVFEMISEILLTSQLEDEKRLMKSCPAKRRGFRATCLRRAI